MGEARPATGIGTQHAHDHRGLHCVRNMIKFLTLRTTDQFMQPLSEQVLEYAATRPEGTPLVAKELLHLGNRAAVDQALSRLLQRGSLLRAGRGIYVLPIEGRFGSRAPSATRVIEGLATQRGETIVSHGAATANVLGLTTQVPSRIIYLTSGRNRRLKLGAQAIELRHAPLWQLILPGHAAGDVVRVLAWLGPDKAKEALLTLRNKVSPAEMKALIQARARLPTWMAEALSTLVRSHG
jgi:hypothetical protein